MMEFQPSVNRIINSLSELSLSLLTKPWTHREQKWLRKILDKWKHRGVNCRIKIDLNSLSERGSVLYFKNKEKHFSRSGEPPGKEMQSVYGTGEDMSFKGKFHGNGG